MRSLVAVIGGSVIAVILLAQQGGAQAPVGAPGSGRLSFTAVTPPDVSRANATIAGMIRSGDLSSVSVLDDPQIDGRRIQSLQQVYRGVVVEGGGVTMQIAGAETLSIFGTVFTDIALDTEPGVEPVDAARIVEREARAPLPFDATPTLRIVPSPIGTFSLMYRALANDAIVYYVDATTGQIAKTVDEKNYDVGVGTGPLGDRKKMATTLIGGTYRTKDTLRPAGISTFDTAGSAAVLDRMQNSNVATDNDLAADSDNTWTTAAIVDAHTNTGAMYDYLFRRHNWNALDNRSRPLSAIVHRALVNNAYFISPPYGPSRNGAMVYGQTTSGAPVSALDVAGHELMHGVTYFSMTARTGGNLNGLQVIPGPSSFTYRGDGFPCNTSYLVTSQNVRLPFLCSGGQYLLASYQGGTLNEGLSDIFGTSLEFFSQPAGSGPLKADYQMGEDVPGLPQRSLSNPSSIRISHDNGTLASPDHYAHLLRYALLVVGGTPANPQVDFSPVGFFDNNFIYFFNSGPDTGGVHYNSTVFSHAFYLAVEGGRNATSGISVTGVGGQNREQIEKVFFRAVTLLMPSISSMQTAAAAVIQAAVDLYGTNSAATQAVIQAMTAVGLR